MKFNSISEALIDLCRGKLIIAADDEDRENEGGFIGSTDGCIYILYALNVAGPIPVISQDNNHFHKKYLNTKVENIGHVINMENKINGIDNNILDW